MAVAETFAAVDLGAESGRVVLGDFDGGRIVTREVHRFPNEPVRVAGGLYWDVLGLFAEVKRGLAKAAGEAGRIESVGVDSWAVDFGLLDRDGSLVSNPFHYRDAGSEGMMERASRRVSREEIYGATGIQFIQINTLYRLMAMEGTPPMEIAEDLLLIPDLMNFWLTGEKSRELTNATTTQLFDPRTGGWAWSLLEKMKIPDRIFGEVVPPATKVGPLLPEIAEELGMQASVTSVASHDTASAVVAVPAEREDFAYISSGTWSLVGLELPEPVITPEAMEANFTNEGGFGGTTRFLRNVMGLWLLQECRREWARAGREYTYEELEELVEAAPAFGPLVDPDHPSFLAPGDMSGRIRRFCEATGQRPPDGPGAVVRCVFESLALKYRWVLERAVEITGKTIGAVHVVGGGSRSGLLCRLTADATGLPVLAGPAEATALGNLMVQAHARGHVGSLAEIRAAVRRSVEVWTYEPGGDEDRWRELQERFEKVVEVGDSLVVQVGGVDG